MKKLLILAGALLMAGGFMTPVAYAQMDVEEETTQVELPAVPAALEKAEYIGKKRPNLKAKVYFIYQSRSTCGICVRELPDIIKAYKKFRRKGVELVMLNIDRDAETAETWVKKGKMTFPVVAPGTGRGIPFPYDSSVGGNTLPCMVAVTADGEYLGCAGGSNVIKFMSTNWKKFLKTAAQKEKEAAAEEAGDEE